jgi:hypothetical protein
MTLSVAAVAAIYQAMRDALSTETQSPDDKAPRRKATPLGHVLVTVLGAVLGGYLGSRDAVVNQLAPDMNELKIRVGRIEAAFIARGLVADAKVTPSPTPAGGSLLGPALANAAERTNQEDRR